MPGEGVLLRATVQQRLATAPLVVLQLGRLAHDPGGEAPCFSVETLGCWLSQAHLEGADLRGAHLEGALLDGAHLEGADLREVKGLTVAQLKLAIDPGAARLPAELASQLAGPLPASEELAAEGEPEAGPGS